MFYGQEIKDPHLMRIRLIIVRLQPRYCRLSMDEIRTFEADFDFTLTLLNDFFAQKRIRSTLAKIADAGVTGGRSGGRSSWLCS